MGGIFGGGGGGGSAPKTPEPIGFEAGGIRVKKKRDTKKVKRRVGSGAYRRRGPRPGVQAGRGRAQQATRGREGYPAQPMYKTVEKKGPEYISVSASPERTALIEGLQRDYQRAADEMNALRTGVDSPLAQLRAGIEASNQSALDRIADAERKTIGNLRENMSRRRILGSSFASDAISRGRAEFGRRMAAQEGENAQRMARTRLQELDMKSQMIDREMKWESQAASAVLDNMNFEVGLAQQMASRTQSVAMKNAQMRHQAAQQESSGLGSLIGTVGGAFLGGPAGASIGSAIGGALDGGGGGGGGSSFSGVGASVPMGGASTPIPSGGGY